MYPLVNRRPEKSERRVEFKFSTVCFLQCIFPSCLPFLRSILSLFPPFLFWICRGVGPKLFFRTGLSALLPLGVGERLMGNGEPRERLSRLLLDSWNSACHPEEDSTGLAMGFTFSGGGSLVRVDASGFSELKRWPITVFSKRSLLKTGTTSKRTMGERMAWRNISCALVKDKGERDKGHRI